MEARSESAIFAARSDGQTHVAESTDAVSVYGWNGRLVWFVSVREVYSHPAMEASHKNVVRAGRVGRKESMVIREAFHRWVVWKLYASKVRLANSETRRSATKS